MRKHVLFAAASLTVAGLVYAADTPSARPDANNPSQLPAGRSPGMPGDQDRLNRTDLGSPDRAAYTRGTLPPGIAKKELDDANDIREALADATEAALNKNNLNSLVGYFVDADRNRIGDWKVADDDAQFKARVDQVQQAWKNKYGGWVDIKSDVALGDGFKDFSIVQGEISDPRLLTNWPIGNQYHARTGTGALDTTNRPGNQPGDRNLEKGRDVAVVSFPASHGLPEVHVSLIGEAFGWKIDVPDNISGQQLRDHLMQGFTKFHEKQAQWPADANEAQRMLTHCVFTALYGVDSSTMGAMDRSGVDRTGTGQGNYPQGTGTGVDRGAGSGVNQGTGTGSGVNQGTETPGQNRNLPTGDR
jgi:hypothetical protein